MKPFQIPATALSWLGRQGTRAVGALVFIGIAVPPLGSVLKPLVPEAVFLLLCTAFLRVDPERLRGYVRRPFAVLAATAWTVLAIPLGFGLSSLGLGLDASNPPLHMGLLLQAMAPPMMASPALAALMGLDATLVLVTLVLSSAVIPFSAPLFAHLFIGPGLSLSPWALGFKLFTFLAGSALVGLTARRLAGPQAIARQGDRIDGFNILILFVFVAAVMEGVAPRLLAAPWATLGLLALAFGAFGLLLVSTTLLFARLGWDRALALGLMASQRNLGLILAATGGALPGLTWLYFGLSQFPIYLSPPLLKPLARRLVAGKQNFPNGQLSGDRTNRLQP